MPFWERSALPLATEGTQECIWNLAYDERRSAIVLELTVYMDEDAISELCCQFPIPADYDGVGLKGTNHEMPMYKGEGKINPQNHHYWG